MASPMNRWIIFLRKSPFWESFANWFPLIMLPIQETIIYGSC